MGKKREQVTKTILAFAKQCYFTHMPKDRDPSEAKVPGQLIVNEINSQFGTDFRRPSIYGWIKNGQWDEELRQIIRESKIQGVMAMRTTSTSIDAKDVENKIKALFVDLGEVATETVTLIRDLIKEAKTDKKMATETKVKIAHLAKGMVSESGLYDVVKIKKEEDNKLSYELSIGAGHEN